MRKTLAALALASLLLIPGTVQASEQCPDPTRPIHYPPLCLTEAEYLALTSPPPPPVAPSPVFVAGVEQWRAMVAYYWPVWAVDRMLRIMACETVPDGNPRSYNPRSGASGLFQIMPGWKKVWPGDYFDPWTNAAVAYQIWLVQGFGAWVCKGT